MKKTITTFCIGCGREEEHIGYSESDVFDYNGTDVPFEDRGYICSVCGDSYTPADLYDEIMQEIKAAYNLMKHP